MNLNIGSLNHIYFFYYKEHRESCVRGQLSASEHHLHEAAGLCHGLLV